MCKVWCAELKRPPLTAPQKALLSAALLLLLVGLANLGRAAVAIYYAIHLPDLPLTAPWGYWATGGIIWGTLLIGSALILVRLYRWGRIAALGVATAYQIHVWVNHLMFDANEYARQVWPRDLLLSGLFLAVLWTILTWNRVRALFD